MCRVLIDTNVLLDAIADDRLDTDSACEVLDRCSGWGEFGMACSLSFKDIYYISAKAKGKQWARDAVRRLMDLLVIAPVDGEVCDRALNSDEPDFEDALIRACAELNGADFIITRDQKAFAHSKIRSVSAAEYLEIARSNDAGYPWKASS